MTPTDEATFIALWEQGLPGDAIAARLGIPPGTVKSRAHALQQQGKIQPRPRGGRRVRPASAAPTPRPVQRIDTAPVQSSVEPTPVQCRASKLTWRR
jgi:hypothetical protein